MNDIASFVHAHITYSTWPKADLDQVRSQLQRQLPLARSSPQARQLVAGYLAAVDDELRDRWED